MIEKIGKISLIFGTFLSIFCVILGLISQLSNWFSNLFGSEFAYYPFFALMPLMAMLLSHLTAWLICFLKARKNSQPHQKMPNSIGVLFKTYFYLWASVTVVIAASGFIFLSFDVYNLLYIFSIDLLLLSLAWFSVVIVSAMVWTAVGAWKTGKFIGVIVAFLAFLLFASASITVGVFYGLNAPTYRYYPRNYTTHTPETHESAIREVQRETQQFQHVVSNDLNVSDEEIYDESESDFERAARFMKFKFELETEQKAIDLIRHWGYWWATWKESDFGNSNSSKEFFRGTEDFHRSKADFYFLVSAGMKNNYILAHFVDNHAELINPRGGILSRNSFVRSGASDCLKILLWAYYDIYSKEDSEIILREIYNYMTRTPEGEYHYDVPSAHYEGLRHYMSDNVVNDINRICIRNTHDVDWATASMAVWAYSFWARRHNDKIDNTVYRVLKIVERMY